MFKAYAPDEKSSELKNEIQTFSTFPEIFKSQDKIQRHELEDKEESASHVTEIKSDPAGVKDGKRLSRNPFAKKYIGAKSSTISNKSRLSSEADRISKRHVKNKNLKSLKKHENVAVLTKEKARELFSESRSGDKANIGMSCMYFADVPLYKRRFKLKHRIGRVHKMESAASGFVRYFRSRKTKMAAEMINFAVRNEEIDLEKPFSYTNDRFSPNLTSEFNSELSRKLQELNMAVTHSPKDLKSWLELCRLQNQVELQSQSDWKSSKLREGALNQQNTAERELAVIEKALGHLPGNVNLNLRRLSLLHHVKTSIQDVKQEWKVFLIAAPNNLLAWSKFFDFLIFNSKSDVDDILASFYTCFRYLIGMKVGTFMSHQLSNNSTEPVLNLFLKLLYFLHNAGRTEKCTGIIQSLLEFNLGLEDDVKDLDAPIYEQLVSSFGHYYASAVPRIGEPNYVTWEDFKSSGVSMANATKELINFPPVEIFLKPELPVWKNWLALERFRTVNHVYPFRNKLQGSGDFDQSTDCEDPERIVDFSFFRKFLYPFDRSERSSLLFHTYLFLANVSKSYSLEMMLSEMRCRMNEQLFHVHLSYANVEFEYTSNVSKLIEDLLNFAGKIAIKNEKILDFVLLATEMRAKYEPETRLASRKTLRSFLQLPGNANNLKVWKVLLEIESINANFQVVKKTVQSLAKVIPSKGSGFDFLVEFNLDCAGLALGVFEVEAKFDLELFEQMLTNFVFKLNQFRKPDGVTFKYVLFQSMLHFLNGRSKCLDIENLLSIWMSLTDKSVQNDCMKILSIVIYRLSNLSLLNVRTCNVYLEKLVERTGSFHAFKSLCFLNCKVFMVSKVRRIVDAQMLRSEEECDKFVLLYTALLVETLLEKFGQNNVFRMKSILERTVTMFPNIPYAWNKLLFICLNYSRSQQDVHDAYQSATSCLPLNKNLVMLFLPFFPEQLELTLKGLLEKKIRVRSPIEEVELYLNEICTQ